MKISKKVALGAVVTSFLVLGVPMVAVQADSNDTRHGMCYLNDVKGAITEQDIGVAAVMTTPGNTPDTGAEIDCKVTVNFSDAGEIDVRADAAGVIRDQQPVSFDDGDGAYVVELCEQDIDGTGGSTGWICEAATQFEIPPQSVTDLINSLRTIPPQPVTDLIDSLSGPRTLCTTQAGEEVCASLTPKLLQGSYAVNPPNSGTGPDTGSIEMYDFAVPGAGTVAVPCVVLVSGGTTTDPCAAAGGTDTGTRLATLSDAPTTPVATVRVCSGDLKLSVDGTGIVTFAHALMIC